MRIDPRFSCALFIFLIFELCGCTRHAQAPITQKSAVARETVTIHRSSPQSLKQRGKPPSVYVVKRGDTLYSIAWKFGLDFRSVSRWNGISNPNLIFVGQKLRLTAGKKSPTRKKKIKKDSSRAPPATVKKRPSPVRKNISKAIVWSWPATGKVQPASSALGTKGIEILGKAGQPVKAAGRGTVVYSGSGLRGYGQLIIVKHNEQFLSAYAHNARLVVSEGESVSQGQKIAEMGDTEADRVTLHFEIRRDGKAVAPLEYLPRR